jgi:transposase-like protein
VLRLEVVADEVVDFLLARRQAASSPAQPKPQPIDRDSHSKHRRHKRLNNRAENSHLPTRKRERMLQRFKSAEHAQRFLGPFYAVCNHFHHGDTVSPHPPID